MVDELLHYGVKGMKWGVRKRDTTPTDVSVTQKRPGTKVTTSGGKNQPASEDAKKAAATYQKAKSSTTDSLSNKELQELVNRMNLEANYARLAESKQSKGKKFVRSLLGDYAKAEGTRAIQDAAQDDPRLKSIADALQKNVNNGGKKKK